MAYHRGMSHVPYICLLYAFGMIYVPRFGWAAPALAKLPGGYDNRDPRTPQAKLEGLGRRAVNAHTNGFETFAPFAVALLVALRSPHHDAVAWLAIAFCALRTIYVVAYLTDRSTLRSSVWTLGTLCVVALFGLAITA